MNKVILVRHAAYQNHQENDPGISDGGRQQADRLAQRIKRLIGDSIPVIWSSPAQRARDTAQIVDGILGYNLVDFKPLLWSDFQHPHNFEWLETEINSLRETDQETWIIIITHLEYVQEFPQYVGFKRNHSEYAQGVYFDEDGRLLSINL